MRAEHACALYVIHIVTFREMAWAEIEYLLRVYVFDWPYSGIRINGISPNILSIGSLFLFWNTRNVFQTFYSGEQNKPESLRYSAAGNKHIVEERRHFLKILLILQQRENKKLFRG